ncbi:hypothetical protein SAMN02745207_02175 [Clostridium grantii DSM 8605]|uniref:Uncharacterized protein n=1 Tax=Clostridium grantii DSM 8605 TaxID=1121316 RepID=A0A1M5VB20_9CLOT|nr:hypothetical protein SAMN02745207_02175 [Clostridium grantii DSM 8605]
MLKGQLEIEVKKLYNLYSLTILKENSLKQINPLTQVVVVHCVSTLILIV